MGRPPCCDKLGVKKGPWTPEEDIMLVSYVQENGPGNWRAVPTNTGLSRCSKSCRLRWTNYLRPGIRRGNFTDHEEKMIIQLQALLGNKWAAIASYLPERTDNDIKNYWNTHLKKKLKKLQLGSGSLYSAGGISSTSNSISRGQWEKRLQTDIHTAKQALHEALLLSSQEQQPMISVPDHYSGGQTSSSTSYASSTENIARLLQNWMKKSSPKSSVNNNDNNVGGIASNDSWSSDESQIGDSKSGIDLSEAFESVFGFDSCNSDLSQSMSPDEESKTGESNNGQAQAVSSVFENWLLLDIGCIHGKDDLTNFSFDEVVDLF